MLLDLLSRKLCATLWTVLIWQVMDSHVVGEIVELDWLQVTEVTRHAVGRRVFNFSAVLTEKPR